MNFSDGLSIFSFIIACLAFWLSYQQHKVSTNPKLYFRPYIESYRQPYQFDESKETDKQYHRSARIMTDIRNDSLSIRVSQIRVLLDIEVKTGFRKSQKLRLHMRQVEYLDPGRKATIRNWYVDGEFESYLETALMRLRQSMLHRHPVIISDIETMNTLFIIDELNQVKMTFTMIYQPAIHGIKEKKITKKIVFTPSTIDLNGEQILDRWQYL